MITHIANLQKLFMDMKLEFKNHKLNELSEIMLTLRIMSTLGKEYNSFRDVWDSLPAEKQTLASLIEKLCNIQMRDLHSSQTKASRSALVLHRKEFSEKQKSEKKKSKENLKERFPCRRCQELGHCAAECPKKLSEENTSEKKPPEKKPEGASSFMVHTLEASMGVLDTTKWYCDSGATMHISPKRDFFEDLEEFERPETISLGRKGIVMSARGKGSVRIRTEVNGKDIILRNVLYVPDASANLLSVKAVAANGHSTTFTEDGIVIRENSSGKIVATGRPHCGLYAMDMVVVQPIRVNLSKPDLSLPPYHGCFAHQDKQHVKQLLKRLNVRISPEDDGLCDGCATGKMHRSPFRPRKDRATKVGEVIHSDVCGPMEVPSIGGGARYYVCFKDDYSRYRSLFFLARKTATAIRDGL